MRALSHVKNGSSRRRIPYSGLAELQKRQASSKVNDFIKALESEEKHEEPSWKPHIDIRDGTLKNRILSYLKNPPKEFFVPRPDEQNIVNAYLEQLLGFPNRRIRRLFDPEIGPHNVRQMLDPILGQEYARVRRIANRETNVPPIDWREKLVDASPILMQLEPFRYSSVLWHLRLEALVDFGVIGGFKEVIKDFEKMRADTEEELRNPGRSDKRFNYRAVIKDIPRMPSLNDYEECQRLGLNPPVLIQAYMRAVSTASSSLRDRLIGGYAGGNLNEVGMVIAKFLKKQGLDMSKAKYQRVVGGSKKGAGVKHAPLVDKDGQEENQQEEADDEDDGEQLALVEQVQVGIGFFRLLRKHLTICGEPLFTERKNQVGFVHSSQFFAKSKFDFHEFSVVTINPKMSALLDALSKGDPPTYYATLTDKSSETFWMPTPTGPKLVLKHHPFPVDLEVIFMRANANVQHQGMVNASFPGVLAGLNCLGSVRWSPNWDVIHAYENGMRDGTGFGDMVPETLEQSYENLVLTYSRTNDMKKQLLKSKQEKVESLKRDREKVMKLIPGTPEEKWKTFSDGFLSRRLGKTISDMESLNFARKYTAERSIEAAQTLSESFTIPYNLDFRGRCYPITKSLNPTGDDFSRGILKFNRAIPLGPRGFFWLKVHLANQFGQDKLTFDDRSQWVMRNLHHVMASVPERDKPFEYYYDTNAFWAHAKSPIQGYAACVELASAMRHHTGNPFEYPSSLPVHQDGSCNGLQHYAAIARDEIGGASVNLTEAAQPADVYSEVVSEVKETIDRDAQEYQEMNFNDVFLGTMFAEWERAKRIFEVRGDPIFDPLTGVQLQGRLDLDPDKLRQFIQMKERKMMAMSPKDRARMERRREIEDQITDAALAENPNLFSGGNAAFGQQIEAALQSYRSKKRYQGTQHVLMFLVEMYTANAVQNVVNRNLVKQTVMTSVYGVTQLGAQKQIMGRLVAAKEAGQLPLVHKEHLFFISRYLTALTIEATENLFESAFGVMAWLKRAGKTVTRFGQPLSWTTPLGLPVTQTYSRVTDEDEEDFGKLKRNKWMVGLSLGHNSDVLPDLEGRTELQSIHSQKQASAFPPNFVHSLDSTHMLITANRCAQQDCDFAAVHDSYWSHAANVDFMARALREEFVRLHDRDLLRELLVEWQVRYPFMRTMTDTPERGTLDLKQVLRSPYFFS